MLLLEPFVWSYKVIDPSMQHKSNISWLGENLTQLVCVGKGTDITAILCSLSCCETS